jgi:hypothetical protein
MRKIIILFVFIGLFSTLTLAQDKDLIKIPLENYLQGHATGKGEFHQKAIYPESRLLWVRDGKLNQRTTAEYIKGSSGKPADDETSRKRWVEMVEIKGNAAIAKIVLDYRIFC